MREAAVRHPPNQWVRTSYASPGVGGSVYVDLGLRPLPPAVESGAAFYLKSIAAPPAPDADHVQLEIPLDNISITIEWDNLVAG